MPNGTVNSFPPIVARLTRHLPLLPLERLISEVANRVASQHPEFFDRLDEYAKKSFVIVPTDLDWIACLSFHNEKVQLRLSRSLESFANRDVTVTAPFFSLVSLLDGEEDGDALFFSRDLTIEGDTEAVLALRNALDDAEIDFVHECSAIAGPLSQPLEAGGKRLIALLKKSPLMRGKQEEGATAPMMDGMPGPYPT
ncbi:SCP2 sterol-binding domain-containing protein [uncultured Cohaesibacter sp.]|uniref:ubiquinone anaerobic biosynthesis accessory factor UbiT n=1 Tax=uncultured Cohaesibacter sp. TaxID=1002546 RepID=UPI0029C6D92E|nr:SCP2 sterol-binding domain-containing protein [uncultured Cohaesibacter sp.]